MDDLWRAATLLSSVAFLLAALFLRRRRHSFRTDENVALLKGVRDVSRAEKRSASAPPARRPSPGGKGRRPRARAAAS
jgi:hypothetical protein